MIIPDGFAQVNFIFTGANVPLGAQCTLGVDLGEFTDPDLVAEAMRDNWSANIATSLTNDVNMSSVLVKFGPNQTGPSTERAESTPGTIVDDSLSPNTAYLVHKNTLLGGRRGRGRMFIPGTRDSVVDDSGVIGAGTLTSWQSDLDDFRAQMITDGLIPVVLHDEGETATPDPTTIVSFTIDSRVATQRRRLRR